MVVSYTVGCRISVESRKKYFRVIFAIFGHFWAQKSRNFSKNNFFLKFFQNHFYRFLAKKKKSKKFLGPSLSDTQSFLALKYLILSLIVLEPFIHYYRYMITSNKVSSKKEFQISGHLVIMFDDAFQVSSSLAFRIQVAQDSSSLVFRIQVVWILGFKQFGFQDSSSQIFRIQVVWFLGFKQFGFQDSSN